MARSRATPPSPRRPSPRGAAGIFLALGIAVGSPSPAYEGPSAYRGARLIPVESAQTWTLIADLNGDGEDDLVALLLSGDRIAILLSRPGGGFERADLHGDFQGSLHAVAGRVDSDATADLVVGLRAGARVLFGNGDGSFREGPLLPSIFVGRTVALADLDGDSAADVLLADQNAGALRVFLGDGTGGFSAPMDAGFQSEPHDFDLADLDGDGHLDAVAPMGNDDLLGILAGNGDGTFDAARLIDVGKNNRYAAVADFDGDGRPDVAVSHRGAASFSVLRGRGDGTFLEPSETATVAAPDVLEARDWDGDGRPDVIVTGGEADGLVAIHLGRGDGTFLEPRVHSAGAVPVSLSFGDLDRDGRTDIVVGSDRSTFATLLRGGPRGAVLSARSFALDGDPVRLLAADLDGEGYLDLAALVRGKAGCALLLAESIADGPHGFEPPIHVDGPTAPVDLLAADIDGDGIGDLAFLDLVDGVVVRRGDGLGGFEPSESYSVGLLPSAVVVGRFDAGPTVDLAVADRGSNDVALLPGKDGGGLGDAVRTPVGTGPVALVAGDWDGDGLSDLAVVNRGSADLSILRGGFAGLGEETRLPCGGDPVAVTAADIDGDAHLDLVVADAEGDELIIYRGVGGGEFLSPVGITTGPEPIAVAAIFPTPLAPPDIVVACAAAGGVWIHRNDGAGAFPSFEAYSTGRLPASVAVGDLDGDGVADVACADSGSGRISVLDADAEGFPTGLFRRGHANDDGRLDISDPIGLLGYLFLGGDVSPCPDALDANDDGRIDLSDAVFSLSYLFGGGATPPAPGPDGCGFDPTADDLGPCAEPCL